VTDQLTAALSIWAPPPELTVSQWADAHRRLSSEASAEPGRWRTDRAPYQRGIMDAMHDPEIHTIVIMSSAQVGKSEILLNIVGYYIHQDPAPILLLQPTLDMAEAFSKDRIATMVRDTPPLNTLIADPRSRDSGNTLLHKKFPGGHLTLAGANSPASLASRPVRIVLADEVDRYPASAGAEGDPVQLAMARTKTFWNRKIVLTSTPTLAGISRIEKAWQQSDQRRYFVPCPECGHYQPLEWEQITFDEHKPETAACACRQCGVVISEQHKPALLAAGRWVGGADSDGIAGFHLNELYSPWRSWADVARDYLRAKDIPDIYKTWVNTSLGLPYEDRDGDALSPDQLLARREAWREALLPAEIVLLTAGIDTQQDRLEAVLLGWTSAGQCLVICQRVFDGSPNFPQVWHTLDAWLLQTRKSELGADLRIRAACIDSGGSSTQAVYEFASAREGRDIYAIKGVSGPKPAWPDRASRSRKHRSHRVWNVGVDTIKDMIRARLTITEGPGRIRFGSDLYQSFFRQLTIERRVIKHNGKGRPVRSWVKPSGARNEAWDCTVYGFAALEALKAIRRLDLSRLSVSPASTPAAPTRKVVRSRTFGKGAPAQ
jgi:phage terminase large subunit GpA-like protein